MRSIIGTAGHIDHGKSALVRALTGIDTDRLPEERERGISIELGFAFFDLGDGDKAGIVDVPGHERFVRQMLSGAQGFDIVLVVVAADDGVMPQTEEHFEIVHLLGVRRAVFVMTKRDLVDAARAAEVRDDIAILAAGTPFEDSPVFEVSSTSGEGVDDLAAYLRTVLSELERDTQPGPFRMPLDRVFVIKGHGVVTTGTAAGGSVAAGDELLVLPEHKPVRVRSVQVHGETVERAWTGQRVALNLSGVSKDDLSKGDTLATPGADVSTRRFDAHVEIRPSAGAAVASHDRVRLHIGTDEVAGRIIWLGGIETVAPRKHAYAQVTASHAVAAYPGDRFVLRDETAQRTLGGGVVIVSNAPRHRRSESNLPDLLSLLESGDDTQRVETFLELGTGIGRPPAEVGLATGLDRDRLRGVVAASPGLLALPDDGSPLLIATAQRYQDCVSRITAKLQEYHSAQPAQAGMELEQLRKESGIDIDARLFRGLVEVLEGREEVVRRGSKVALAGHEVSVGGADEDLATKLLGTLVDSGFMPPAVKDLAPQLEVTPAKLADLINVLVGRGQAVRVSGDLVFASGVVSDIAEKLRRHLEAEGEISASGFRDLISASRKYCIPLLGYFDSEGLTVRSGDVRRLRPTA